MPTAIVTGGNSGIGRSISVALARSGFDIGFTWHSEEERAEEAAQEIIEAGARAMHSQVDLHDVDAGLRVFEDMVEVLGEIDVLVNNAGYGSTTPIVEMELDEFRGVVDVDLIAPFTLMKAAARRMIDQGRGGKIVNMASQAGRRGEALVLAYCASKACVISMTQSMALALAPHKINVNGIAPGIVDTPLWVDVDKQFAKLLNMEVGEPKATFIKSIPLGRIEQPEDVTGAAVFLASTDSDYITQQTLNVDGGNWPS
jgi:D-sorbitol dehydrogenase (acceptor)